MFYRILNKIVLCGCFFLCVCMDFIKNNKLTCCLGVLCLFSFFLCVNKKNVISKVPVLTVADEDIQPTSLKSSSISLALKDEINPNTILESGSRKLIKESGEDLKIGLMLKEDEPDDVDIKKVAEELGKMYTPKGYIEYEVARGDTLTGIWLKNGASRVSSLRAADAFKKSKISLSSLRIGEVLRLYIKNDTIN